MVIRQDFVTMIETKTSRIALVVENAGEASKHFGKLNKIDVVAAYDEAYGKAKGSHDERTMIATQAVLGNSKGVGLYVATNDKKDDFIKLNPQKKE